MIIDYKVTLMYNNPIKISFYTSFKRGYIMTKIKMSTPLVEMDGDEMTRVLWKMIKDELINPFVDLKAEYYDLRVRI